MMNNRLELYKKQQYTGPFAEELELIQGRYIREQTRLAIEHFPKYFYDVMSSSTGKYHAEGETLYLHTRRDAILGADIVNLKMLELSPVEKDLVIAALILHDCCKYGMNDTPSEYVLHQHPILASQFVWSVCEPEFAEKVAPLVAAHSGQWTSSKYSQIELPEPKTKLEKIVHLVDYIASRRYVEIKIEEK